MTTTTEERKRAVVDDIVALAVNRLPAGAAEAAEHFVRRYYASVAPSDILGQEPEDLLGAALSLWELGERRRSGEAKVRVFNPVREESGFETPYTVVEVINDDMPFLVDSVTGELNRRGHAVHLVVHPIVPVRRDDEGRLREIGGTAESFMHLEIDREESAEARSELQTVLEQVLDDVRTAVFDWPAMRRRLDDILGRLGEESPAATAEELTEVRTFLRWLDDNHFTFLGFREYRLVRDGEARVVPGTPLGLLRRMMAGSGSGDGFPLSPETAPPATGNRLLLVSKAGRRSTVHRPVHMDYVGVRRLDREGRVTGGWSFVGLFTSGVYYGSARNIPLVRRKIDRIVERAGLPAASHDAKALLHILETFPRDELFQMSEEELYRTSLGILQLQERQRFALFVRRDASERFISCLVYIPRDRYNTDLRKRVQEILEEAFGGTISAFYTQVADSPLARAHFIVRTDPGKIPDYDLRQIEARLADASRTWDDRLREALAERFAEAQGLVLSRRYRDAFPAGYREDFDPESSLDDIAGIERVLAGEPLSVRLHRGAGGAAAEVGLKIYHRHPLRPLSDVLPMLEHMGLEVISEVPYEVRPEDADLPVWIRDFALATADRSDIDLEGIRENFQEALGRVWSGAMESDDLNHLVLAAGLGWRQVVLLRAYARYLKQAEFTFSQSYIADTLAHHPKVTGLLVQLFLTRFDPEHEGDRKAAMQRVENRIKGSLNAVTRLDEDRILRRLRNLVRATLRTNYFRRTADGAAADHLSLKLDSRRVKGLPRPRPMYEIFVYSPRTEAVHLRGGPVARGGIRWSDRQEDFRTEILGLMKAQMVKNAVIVPVGAKGGFIVKRPPAGGHEELLAEGVECYKTMIRGLLDLTDNFSGAKVVPPPGVVRWDDNDPYLVVAADKGTATFSDIANGVAAEYGFWLSDAFASGGSAGYDHKKMAITARGAWESVKRHFRELGQDIQSEEFTAVGVGDMSGDVFGNAMLLSEKTRLVGAFNHRHIFVDPDPDPAASYAERRRLFDLPRSSWQDYDPGVLSEGGGVFERSAKEIRVSPQIKKRLRLPRVKVTPNQLIRALLTADVDLLFFGGIGTYVKASDESHAATGDRQNDGLRVDAPELSCRVIGEGANLGATQRGRIEYALAGGRINTDFIDNSGGVDCSDHEVNIKILLGDVMTAGELALGERNQLLQEMTDEVAQLVLRDNYLQSQAITVAATEGGKLLDQQERLMRNLERSGRLDRGLEFLPGDEAMAERREHGVGLTRPEIAVLLAYAKISLFEELLASEMPDDPLLLDDLALYFPRPLRLRFPAYLEQHRLRREIITTHVTNSMVNRVGPTFVARLAAETSKSATEIARAYTIARDAFDLRDIWGAIESLDNQVPAELQLRMIREVGRLVERVTLWLLRKGRSPLHISRGVARLRPAAAVMRAELENILSPRDLGTLRERTERYEREGVPRSLARSVASLDFLASVCDIARIAADSGKEVEEVARIYFEVGARFGLEWLRTASEALGAENSWSKAAAEALVADLFVHQSELTKSVLTEGGDARDQLLAEWSDSRKGAVERLDQLLSELESMPVMDLAMLTVANHQLRLLQEG